MAPAPSDAPAVADDAPAAAAAAAGGAANRGPAEVLRLPGNACCFDCDAGCKEDAWVSLNHGTVICLSCAGLHRSLGVHVSFVRSLNLDQLKPLELKALLLGGNERFRHFLEDPAQNVLRHVWLALPAEVRYHTPAADLYRRRLEAEVKGSAELPTELRRVVPPPPTTSAAPAPAATVATTPAWTSDAAAARCELCKADFGLLSRRHHCRRCGRCICANCSPPDCMRPLPQLGYDKPCRHCKVCVPPVARIIAGLGVATA